MEIFGGVNGVVREELRFFWYGFGLFLGFGVFELLCIKGLGKFFYLGFGGSILFFRRFTHE